MKHEGFEVTSGKTSSVRGNSDLGKIAITGIVAMVTIFALVVAIVAIVYGRELRISNQGANAELAVKQSQ